MAIIQMSDYVSTEDAAERLSLSVATVRNYCLNSTSGKTPAIEAVRLGRSWYIHKGTLREFKKARRSPGRPVSE